MRDVLEHRPRRYETAADEVAIAALRQGEEVVVSGRVLNVEKRPMRGRRRTRIVARVADDTATISVTWFNQPWLADRLKPGTEVRLRGKLGRFGFEPRSYDIGDEARATADFAPVYPAAEEIAAATVRRVVDAALPLATHFPDPLPAELREREGLALKRDALAAVHRPRDLGEAETGRQRLAFEELLVLQIGIARRAAERERTLAPALGEPGELIHRYRKALAVRAHAVPGASDPRDRRRPRAHRPDAAAPAGRRRLGQDGRRPLRAPARRRERPSGGAHGAD